MSGRSSSGFRAQSWESSCWDLCVRLGANYKEQHLDKKQGTEFHFFFFFWVSVSLDNPILARTSNPLAQPPKCWNYKCTPPYHARFALLFAVVGFFCFVFNSQCCWFGCSMQAKSSGQTQWWQKTGRLCFIALGKWCVIYKLKIVAILYWATLWCHFSNRSSD